MGREKLLRRSHSIHTVALRRSKRVREVFTLQLRCHCLPRRCSTPQWILRGHRSQRQRRINYLGEANRWTCHRHTPTMLYRPNEKEVSRRRKEHAVGEAPPCCEKEKR